MAETRPGVHPSIYIENLEYFSQDEKKILKKISKEWYITNGGERFSVGLSSEYRYCLIKPTSRYKEMFNLEREIIIIFSSYDDLQPRTLDAIETVYKKFPDLRLERICSIIFSRDTDCSKKIKDLLKQDQESQIIIPINYKEYLNSPDEYFIENMFRRYFYTRDLFAFESPLKKDLYFFGRTDIIHKIVNRHGSNENSGLFGLRKTGKTSVIFKIERTLERSEKKSIWIDCQNTAFNNRRWNEALYYIIFLIRKKYSLELETYRKEIGATKFKFKHEAAYTEKDAGIFFEDEITKLNTILEKGTILLIFDEIERITFGVGETDHWADGLDFVFFWQTLRSVQQKLSHIFSYLIVGTNTRCVETPLIQGKDNPLFNSIPFTYIERFDISQTKEMVSKLGNFMGIRFEEVIYGKLTEDFGGHPFLIRHVCSTINSHSPTDRPFTVDRTLYNKAKQEFEQKSSGYFEMMLGILKDYYPDEYIMLENLALGDIDFFNQFANNSPEYTSHLLNYGILSNINNNYDFKIDSIKEHLIRKNKYKKINLSQEEMYRETEERRNKIEPKLRSIIKQQLKGRFGETDAKKKLLATFPSENRSKFDHYTTSELLDANLNKLLTFFQLKIIISKEWETFKHIFDSDNTAFDYKMNIINTIGRADSHSKKITTQEMNEYRTAITWVEAKIKELEV